MSKITKILHNDIDIYEEERDKVNPVIYPIVASTTYKIKDLGKLDDEKYTYSRSDNPTRNLLEKNLALLENAQYGLTFSSGLGVLTIVSSLDIASNGFIASHDLYGGTKRYLNKVYNKEVTYLNFGDKNLDLDDIFTKNKAQLVWCETPSNPLLDIVDISNVSKYCKKYGKTLVVDNTFLSPIFQNPLNNGADIVVHSITKYINGLSDVVMGCCMTNKKDLFDKLKYLQNAMGVTPSPFDCFLVNRSIKTLELRMHKHQDNALKIVELLKSHSKVIKVLYPKLDEGNKEIINNQMSGYGAMITFYIKGGIDESLKFLNRLKTIPVAESLGGVETLIEHPATMTHASIPKKEREEIGITDSLIRLSVGIENYMDIYNDLNNALSYVDSSTK